MKIVVVGGTGLSGARVVARLADDGHDVAAVSTRTGVDTITGDGLAEALEGASVVVDTTGPADFEDAAVMRFFTTSTANLLAAEAAAGVSHHVVLSIVGVDGVPDSGYYRAKVAQEQLVENGSVPYTIVRATQFFEFIRGIADAATRDDTARLPPALVQPIAVDDVAVGIARAVADRPGRRTVDLAGPEQFRLDELVRRVLRFDKDDRAVVTDPKAPYFGAVLGERSLLPGPTATVFTTRFETWLTMSP
jgi:uncharacterized protein YbjT (DUF2867 family)